MKNYKWIALLLALIMIVGTFAACGSTPSDPKESDNNQSTETKQGGEGESDSAKETKEAPKLPSKKYDTVLKVLHWTVDESWIPWEEICLPDWTGDAMDDAIYARTAELDEKYGIALENEYLRTDQITTSVTNMIMTEEDDYQMIVQRGYQFQFLMTTDSFADISALPYVDTTKSYWNQDSIDTFTFGGTTLFAASDMLLLDKGATAAVIFNTSIAHDHGWGGSYFYDLVNDKEWTLAKMVEVAADAYDDADGDSKTSAGDVFGATGGDDPIHFMLNGAGERFCVNTGDDSFLKYTFEKERCYDIVMDTLDMLLYEDFYLSERTVKESIEQPFINNQVLFDISRVKQVNAYRVMDQDYGILPIPMYDDTQDEYYSEISPHHDSLMAIPHTAVRNDVQAEAIGVALEAMSYISSLDVYPVLYDVVISTKGTRDQESKEMLNIIFNNRVYDIGIIFDFGYFANTALRMAKTGSSDIVSKYEAVKDQIDKEIEKVVDTLHGIVD